MLYSVCHLLCHNFDGHPKHARAEHGGLSTHGRQRAVVLDDERDDSLWDQRHFPLLTLALFQLLDGELSGGRGGGGGGGGEGRGGGRKNDFQGIYNIIHGITRPSTKGMLKLQDPTAKGMLEPQAPTTMGNVGTPGP